MNDSKSFITCSLSASCSVLLLLVLITGCQGGKLRTVSIPAEESRTICKVAIFPFQNQTEYALGDLLAYRVFTSELVAAGFFDVMLEGEVRFFFRENRHLAQAPVPRDLYTKLATTMGVEAIVIGSVLEMEEGSEGQDIVVPAASLRLELIDLKDGTPLAVSYHRRSGTDFRKIMHIGVVQTMPELISRMSKEIIQEWKGLNIKECAQ